jgi:hypothetical protein
MFQMDNEISYEEFKAISASLFEQPNFAYGYLEDLESKN